MMESVSSYAHMGALPNDGYVVATLRVIARGTQTSPCRSGAVTVTTQSICSECLSSLESRLLLASLFMGLSGCRYWFWGKHRADRAHYEVVARCGCRPHLEGGTN